ELLDLPEVHRPPRRLLRDGEEPAHFRNRLGGSRYALRLAVLRLAVMSLLLARLTVAILLRLLGPRLRLRRVMTVVLELDEDVAPRLLQRHDAGGRELLGEIAEAARAVRALRERRVELQQRALEQAELRRDFPIREDLQRAPDERHDLFDPLRAHRPRRPATAPVAAAPAAE